ncbi:ChbG/HpnK family deacetylase [uncultured Planococcus sp.]|uniref:ChbG/HpnK family deacetylase n=1 Tax=uncultured Planococcus sp. TaxID=337815 RepID=UPI0026209060|nr:ChbG/HpnK family deacetylase [uncultured Planococcus sp.]
MKHPSVITRADDFGSLQAANQAILQAVTNGYLIKNVSCMAGGPALEDGARLLKNCENIDIGLHLTLISEWDLIKWKPVAPKEKIPSLLNKNGDFYQSQQQLASAQPKLDEILVEYEAQLARLTKLGLKVNYVDSHMVPELFIPGLEKALEEWISSKGLIDASKYYNFADPILPIWGDSKQAYFKNIEIWLNALKKNHQYMYFMHPTKKSDETHLLSNEHFPPGIVEKERELEYQSVISSNWKEWLKNWNIQVLRYSEAVAIGSNNALRQLLNL